MVLCQLPEDLIVQRQIDRRAAHMHKHSRKKKTMSESKERELMA